MDASVLLRVAFGERPRLRAWRRITTGISSELIRLECLRTVDRARITDDLDEEQVAFRRASVLATLEGMTLVPITPTVLARASQPFPTLLRSLDAIHLSTALLLGNSVDDLVFATHDVELATAATAMGFAVEGS